MTDFLLVKPIGAKIAIYILVLPLNLLKILINARHPFCIFVLFISVCRSYLDNMPVDGELNSKVFPLADTSAKDYPISVPVDCTWEMLAPRGHKVCTVIDWEQVHDSVVAFCIANSSYSFSYNIFFPFQIKNATFSPFSITFVYHFQEKLHHLRHSEIVVCKYF